MGQRNSVFTESELQDYKDLTFFTKKEILHAYKRFRALAPEIVSRNRLASVPSERVLAMPELKVNPFRDRISKVFSSDKDGSMTFEDFLDMMSVFSESAPFTTKTEYAFRIFDFDEDDMLGRDDIRELLTRLTNNRLSDDEMDQVADHILEEADLDEDGYLAYAEFEHVITKSPDFVHSFCIRL